jgi:hypothetical protein
MIFTLTTTTASGGQMEETLVLLVAKQEPAMCDSGLRDDNICQAHDVGVNSIPRYYHTKIHAYHELWKRVTVVRFWSGIGS